MSYNWIKSEDYSMDTFLLFDRWVIRYCVILFYMIHFPKKPQGTIRIWKGVDTWIYTNFGEMWVIRYIMDENKWYNDRTRNYISDMAKALSRYPYVITFGKRKF